MSNDEGQGSFSAAEGLKYVSMHDCWALQIFLSQFFVDTKTSCKPTFMALYGLSKFSQFSISAELQIA